MTLPQIETIEAAWRILKDQPSPAARDAASHIVEFLEELDDDGVIDGLNEGRSAADLIAGLVASSPKAQTR